MSWPTENGISGTRKSGTPGLLAQRLVNDGYASAGVSISSAPPQGVISFSPHFLRANFPHINPFAGTSRCS